MDRLPLLDSLGIALQLPGARTQNEKPTCTVALVLPHINKPNSHKTKWPPSVNYWLSYLTWTRKVGGACGQDKICTAAGPLSKALNPTLLQGACLLLSLINCKSLLKKASAK